MRDSRGFTLLELLIVIVIIGILAGIVVPGLVSGRDRARISNGTQFAGYAHRVAGDGVVGKWNLDEGSGTAATDSSGFGANGTLTNGPTWSTDTYSNNGGSVLFDGVNDHINVPFASSLAPTAGITFGAWFKANSLSGTRRVISKTETGGYTIAINEVGTCLTSDSLCTLVWIGGGYKRVEHPASNLETGKWYHVLSTYDGAHLKMYLDGNEVASLATTGSIFYTYSNPLCIGAEAVQVACSGNYFSGYIDEVRVYGKGLVAQEVRPLYLASLARLVSDMMRQ